MKLCPTCKVNAVATFRHKTYAYCKTCLYERNRQWRRNNREHCKSKKLESTFGISIHEYNRLFESQGLVCAVCGRANDNPRKAFPVDHNHTTNKVRGILCHACNRGIGLLQDSPDVLRRAAEYINVHSTRSTG